MSAVTNRLDPAAAALAEPGRSAPIRVDLRVGRDAMLVRQRARDFAALAGLGAHEQTAFAAAVSEVSRNAIVYAGGGLAELWFRHGDPAAPHHAAGSCAAVVARVTDAGPGIADVGAVLAGRNASANDTATQGLIAARRLSDEFDIESVRSERGPDAPCGTRITLARHLPTRADRVGADAAARIAAGMGEFMTPPRGPLEDVQDQNRELLMALDALRARQTEVERLNAELAETNRGVLALYAELDEKAESLQRADGLKTRFLSDMTHELRTPLNAMISLSRLLLDRVDGDLTNEQERQVTLIHRSATSLGEMVNDLLDIARIEAGKTDLYLSEFTISDALLAQRGMFRPLVPEHGRVQLLFDEPTEDCPATLYSDERKLSQILRNLISNALKFTERGEVRVQVDCTCSGTGGTDGMMVRFAVCDTGIGIAPEHMPRMFQDFAQIDSPVQRRTRGTGLGLPLTRKLARLLGGDVSVASTLGVGSTFTLTMPLRLPQSTDATTNTSSGATA